MMVSLEQLINMNYIRYDKLTTIINEAYTGSSAETLNVYIDMYSLIKVLYNNKQYQINDYASLTACIINMCAHYRAFFETRYRVNTRFFIIYSKNCPYINKQFYPEYNSKNEYAFNTNKKVDDMIKNNIELLETLCPYLPDIHFIKGTFETGVIMYDVICRNELVDGAPHLIITKDPYLYQLIPTRNNITILRPKKSDGIDYSYYANNNNLYQAYLESDKSANVMPGLLSLIMTLSSVPERNIKSLLNITSALKIVSKAVFDYKILNGYNSDLQFVWDAIYTDKFKIGSTTFEHRFKSIDIIFQHSVFINTPECKGISYTNLYDPDTVRHINDTYFKSNPLDLNRL